MILKAERSLTRPYRPQTVHTISILPNCVKCFRIRCNNDHKLWSDNDYDDYLNWTTVEVRASMMYLDMDVIIYSCSSLNAGLENLCLQKNHLPY